MLKKIFFVVVVLFSTSTSAKISLSNLFADGMVLQQQKEVTIWGKAASGSKVKVLPSWSEKAFSVRASRDSTWKVKINTPVASYVKHGISVLSDGEVIELKNILIGEVWLCSGQSNMALPLRGASNQGVEGSLKAIAESKNENIRHFGVHLQSSVKQQTDVQGVWQSASPKNTGGFTAVGYFFARQLQKVLDVPVGIIACAWGGSRIEAWMSEESLSQFDFVQIPKSEADNKVKMQTPTVLFNGMLSGILGFEMKGVLWYQGESNRDVYKQYPELFKAMHKDWVKRWDIGEFPIYFAQIAPFAYENMDNAPLSALMREAQLEIANNQDNTGMIVLSDLGDSLCIHPSQKREVGERFAYMALGRSYGMDYLNYQSPQYKSIQVKDDKILVSFDSPLGVTFKGNERTGFQIAGSDKKFHLADVYFNPHYDKKITLFSSEVPHPVAVRYGWKNFFKATLFGTNGLPVSSFRSDDWDE